jgi:adenylate kinase
MRVVLIGPPGSGKGTQAKLLTERLGLTCIGTGDILRAAIKAGTPTGKRAEPFLRAGLLAPDELVNEVVAELFRRPDHPTQFVMDGYPRTVAQAVSFDQLLRQEFLNIEAVVNLEISDEEVVRRISGRRVCSVPGCPETYHITDRPPHRAGFCNLHPTSPLTQRIDDREETIRARLVEFHRNTDELIEHYRRLGVLKNISAHDSVEAIYRNIVRLFQPPAKGC